MSFDPVDISPSASLSTAPAEPEPRPVYSTVELESRTKPIRLLPPEGLAFELERFRQLADVTEKPFSMLVCSCKAAINVDSITAFLDELLVKLELAASPIGILDPNRLGIIVEQLSWKDIEDLIEALREFEQVSQWDLTLYSYPFPQSPDDSQMFPLSAQIKHESLQSFLAIPMPTMKRLVDIIFSAAGLFFLSPLFLCIAVLIRCSSSGPVFFRQKRSGLGGTPFVIFKFRSMVNQAELQQSELMYLNQQDGPAFKIIGDPRVTRIGQFLRHTCLDELPQLYNVLRGDMSLVGPRPLPCHESDSCQWWQRRRLDVTPGITCTWQARGRDLVSFDQWMRMDLDYVQNRSLKLDFQIILSTFKFLLARR
jgi:lipopolysaccharide/colanic/teichoic acid biosynthesis glycosyltransferase